MHSAEAQGKGDISILPGRGHFYFALTKMLEQLIEETRNLYDGFAFLVGDVCEDPAKELLRSRSL